METLMYKVNELKKKQKIEMKHLMDKVNSIQKKIEKLNKYYESKHKIER